MTQEQNSNRSCTSTSISAIHSVGHVEVGSYAVNSEYHFLGDFVDIQQRLGMVCLMLLNVMLQVSTDMTYLRTAFSVFV